MKCIVPLAGPDLKTDQYGLRPLYKVGDQTLIETALKPRAWAGGLSGSDYIFVVREVVGLDALQSFLSQTWPGCKIVTLSHLTQGALFSVLGAVGLCGLDESIIVDLADIVFSEGPAEPTKLFNQGYEAIVPVFTSDEGCYSYLRSEAGDVVEAREKVVISNDASAGVYMFKNAQTFLRAAAHSMDNHATLSHKNMLFICPMINGVIAQGGRVAIPKVYNIEPVGKAFH